MTATQHAPTAAELIARVSALESQHRQLLEQKTALRVALTDCANRLHKCIEHSGSSKEAAAFAVEAYREVVRDCATTSEIGA